MKILYYDCFSGISGDMNLGAMVDLGVDPEYLTGQLKKLKIGGWELLCEMDQRHGISGTKVTVKISDHHHSEHHGHHTSDHHHRHLNDIEKIIMESGLDPAIRELSMKIFMKVAVAEARVHNIPVEKVHFHEVGAIDSIIDIVGAAICYDFLKPDKVVVSHVEVGGGFVKCEHGTLPVPAPATAAILKDIPVKYGGVNFEATTPTGAAILSALGNEFSASTRFRILRTGYGIGQRENPDVPNLLRVFLGEEEVKLKGHDAVKIECNIDDMNPEFYDHLSDRLFRAGASDVFLGSIMMKKGRPGTILNVICENGQEDTLKEIIFTESTTVGMRSFSFRKDTLERKFERINTEFGEVTVKRSFLNGIEVSYKPEYEDCRKIAIELGLPIKEVYNKIISLIVMGK